ncbi:MAG: hemerythrin HHE cation-binding protein [Chloroflexota bacterium]|nr:MAG: hemerythrin HHE cation-binding protein [Chloroflexota bacterium]
MTVLKGLPGSVIDLLQSTSTSEFATVSSAGVPIDTPMFFFPSEGMRSLDVGTGLAYPAKAERVRGNPKTGILVAAAADKPVIAVAGLAAVHDSDLQSNAERYIAETGFARVGNAPWPLAKKAVWYWTRIIVSITPVRIFWWDSPAATNDAPHRWDAPADTVYPKSDPAPAGSLSAAPRWSERSWQELARQALGRNAPGHLTLCDEQGFPIPFRVREIELLEDGFRVDVPRGAPWQRAGKATLTFEGRETFVGDVTADGDMTFLRVERPLPVHPIMDDPDSLWNPAPEVYEAFMGRLRHETARRGQPIPTIPEVEPEPSAGAKVRIARVSRSSVSKVAAD